MWQYIVKQLLQRLLILFIISFLVFITLGQMGDPVDVLKSTNPLITQAQIDEYKKQQGLDKPIVIRYFYWLNNALHGDFGISRQYYTPTFELIMQRIPNTVYLQAIILLIIVLISLPLGIFSAVNQYSTFDYIFTFLAFTGAAIPYFWFALVLIIIFGVLPPPGYRLPFTGMFSDTVVVGGKVVPYQAAPLFIKFVDRIKHLVLPVISGSIVSLSGLTRYTRSALLEVIRQDYVRTARAKGLPERRVIYTHALRNAMIPIATILIQSIPGLLAGSVIMEQIFGWPGMGKLTYDAIMNNDYTLAMTCIMFFSFLTVIFTLIADISYAFLDPRITYR